MSSNNKKKKAASPKAAPNQSSNHHRRPTDLDPLARLRKGNEFGRELVQWLWSGRIAIGKLNIIQGDGGLGKSLIAVDIAARVTTGRAFPFCTDTTKQPAGGVLFLSVEDDAEDTLGPRMDAAGADPDRWRVEKIGYQFSIDKEAGWLMAVMEKWPELKLIVFDPITEYFGGKVDSNNNQHIRTALAPIIAAAAEFNVAIIAINHINKQRKISAGHRGMASAGLRNLSRAGFSVIEDPDQKRHRLLMPNKANLAKPSDNMGIRFEVVEKICGVMGGQPVIDWIETVEGTADDAQMASDDLEARTKLAEAKNALISLLQEGPKTGEEVKAMRKEEGIARNTLTKANNQLPQVVVEHKRDGQGIIRGSIWSLQEGATVKDEKRGQTPDSLVRGYGVLGSKGRFSEEEGATVRDRSPVAPCKNGASNTAMLSRLSRAKARN